MEKKEIITLITVTAVAVAAVGIGISRNHSRKSEMLKTANKPVDTSPKIESVLIAQKDPAFEEHPAFQPFETVAETEEFSDPLPLEYNGQGAVGWTFPEAFAEARTKLGPGKIFIWNGRNFTTLYAEELVTLATDTVAGDELAVVDTVEAKQKPETKTTEEEEE